MTTSSLNQCVCAENCSTCAVDSAALNSRCLKCASPATFVLNRIDEGRAFGCIAMTQCSGFVNTLTKECVVECPSDTPYVNSITREC